ncbi:MAG: methylamine utilization protein MauE [Deltaproteobacteria bacterium]|nr:methylamine utilization protein MauE [Deltaproteobacteria bacterium]
MSGADPVFAWLARIALALLFAGAALHKLRDLGAFAATLRDYRILPLRILPHRIRPRAVVTKAAALALAALELGSAAALLLPAADPVGPLAALALLILYSAAIALNLARGRRHIDCGCLGPGHRQPLAPWLLARNAAIALGPLLLLLLDAAPRPVSWIDGISLAGGVAILALLWNAVHQLGAAQPALPAAGSSP